MELDKHIKNNKLLYKTFLLALEIVKLYKYLTKEKHEYVMSKQMLKAGTSVGANSNEAVAGQSKKDFIAKLSIAMKESSETRYWLYLLVFSDYLTEKEIKKALNLLRESMNLIGLPCETPDKSGRSVTSVSLGESLITSKQNLENEKKV